METSSCMSTGSLLSRRIITTAMTMVISRSMLLSGDLALALYGRGCFAVFCNCTRYLHVLCVAHHDRNLNTQKHYIGTRVLSASMACLFLSTLAIYSSWHSL